MKKYLAFVVIFLFIGLAVAPSINANISKDTLVEFTTEVCGLNGGKQTVRLTQKEAEEVEALFDSIRERLNTTDSREEAGEIFKEVVVELDKYGLLGGLSVNQAQRLILSSHKTPIINRVLERLNNKNSISLDDNENLFCLMTGKTTYTMSFQKPIATFLFYSGILLYHLGLEKLSSWFFLFWLYSYIFVYENPIPILFKIGMGKYFYDGPDRNPAHGWIITLGMNGKKSWNKSFYGQLPRLLSIPIIYPEGEGYPAVIGYTGVKLQSSDGLGFYYLGSALCVKIGSEPPF